MKSKQNAELELADVQVQLEDVSRARADLDQKNLTVGQRCCTSLYFAVVLHKHIHGTKLPYI